jgi:hypothetical protein
LTDSSILRQFYSPPPNPPSPTINCKVAQHPRYVLPNAAHSRTPANEFKMRCSVSMTKHLFTGLSLGSISLRSTICCFFFQENSLANNDMCAGEQNGRRRVHLPTSPRVSLCGLTLDVARQRNQCLVTPKASKCSTTSFHLPYVFPSFTFPCAYVTTVELLT